MDGFGDSRHTIVGRRGDASHVVATVEFICPQGAFSLDNHLSELLAIGCHHPLCPNKDMFICLYFYQRTSVKEATRASSRTLLLLRNNVPSCDLRDKRGNPHEVGEFQGWVALPNV